MELQERKIQALNLRREYEGLKTNSANITIGNFQIS